MRVCAFALVGIAAMILAACSQPGDGNAAADANAAAPAAADPGAKSGTLADALGRPEHARLAAAVQAAGMTAALQGPVPYTLLVPSDQALARAGDLDRDKERLARLISAHILPGTVTAEDIGKAVAARGGRAQLATMAGSTLTATREGNRTVLAGPGGEKVAITGSEAFGNGVLHRIDGLLSPPA
jgi:uncharacterized surface protein with fasciclin (FAS1) repeats